MESKFELNAQELMILQSEMRREEKSLGIAYLMLLGGHLGMHRFYTRRQATGAVQLALFIATIAFYIMAGVVAILSEPLSMTFLAICGITFAVLTVWIIVDLFLLPKQVKLLNKWTEQELIRSIISMRKGLS